MTTMPMSPTDEIRAIRHELAARFDNDLERIVADLRRQQQESGNEYITLPRRPTSSERVKDRAATLDDKAVHIESLPKVG